MRSFRKESVRPPLARLDVNGKQAGVDESGRRCYNNRMNKPLKVQKIGNSAGVILPKELLAELGAEVGGTLSVTRTPRGVELSASKPEFDVQMQAAREIMVRYRDALRELAK